MIKQYIYDNADIVRGKKMEVDWVCQQNATYIHQEI